MVGHAHGIGHSLEVVDTVLEVADVAWRAIEHRRHGEKDGRSASLEEEISSLEAENRRLRTQLQDNLNLLQTLAQSSALSKDCPPDLHPRLAATVESSKFLIQLESLHQPSIDTPNSNFPFEEATGADLHLVEYMVNVNPEEPSWWVWVAEEMVPSNKEEWSGIDNENYVIVCEDHVVEGVANFLARCILSNPRSKNMTPEELQKTVAKALGSMNNWNKLKKVWEAGKLIYALSTWGIALAASTMQFNLNHSTNGVLLGQQNYSFRHSKQSHGKSVGSMDRKRIYVLSNRLRQIHFMSHRMIWQPINLSLQTNPIVQWIAQLTAPVKYGACKTRQYVGFVFYNFTSLWGMMI